MGYESYDAASNTYTWIAGGRIDSNYALSEQNYLLEDIASASYYRISDTANPGSWQSYDDDTPVQTAMASYPADTPQRRYRTVAFQNSYLDTGTLTLNSSLPGTTVSPVSCAASPEPVCIPTCSLPTRNIPRTRVRPL